MGGAIIGQSRGVNNTKRNHYYRLKMFSSATGGKGIKLQVRIVDF